MTAWIRMLCEEDASPELTRAFDETRTPSGTIDNVMRVHSLRPQTMIGHYRLYMSVLHDDANTLPMWFQEVIASYVSVLNRCAYSLSNHFANARHLIGNDARAERILAALERDKPELEFAGGELAMLRYARKLTLTPAEMGQADVQAMRSAGLDDGEILEVNQITGYFNYVNRQLNGLGVSQEGDLIGFYSTPPRTG